MTIDEQIEFLKKGAVEVIREADLKAKLERAEKAGKPLRIKLGLDPTAPDIHLGHTVVIRKLKAFQELGHTVIFLIGDFTGMIGDPSGKNVTRPPLSREEIDANAQTYRDQMFRLLDPEKTEVRFNSEWMDKLTPADMIKLAAKTTVRQILERDDFEQRMADEKPISLHELLYPLVQGYDSVALESGCRARRHRPAVQPPDGPQPAKREFGQEPQVIVTTPLLEGLDGVNKMSKSLDNYIGIEEPPDQVFGKVMSISDDLMWRYYELLTETSIDEVNSMKFRCESAAENPRDLKVELAKKIIADLHSQTEAGETAAEEFDRRFVKKEKPVDIALRRPTGHTPGRCSSGWPLTEMAGSKNQARRLACQARRCQGERGEGRGSER